MTPPAQPQIAPSAAKPLAENAAVWILSGTAVLAPIFLGASGIWSRLALEAAIVVAACLWAMAGTRSVWATLLPVVVCGTTLLQLLPLPDRLLVDLAPVSAGAWKLATGGATDTWGRISVNPAATLAGIQRLFLACTVVAMVTETARRKSYRNRLLAGLATSGMIILVLGGIFGRDHGSRVLGVVDLIGPFPSAFNPTVRPVQSAGFGKSEWETIGTQRYQVDFANVSSGIGPYIYSNHFAGAVVLTLPIMCAWWLLAARGRLHDVFRWGVAILGLAGGIWFTGIVADSRAGVAALTFAWIIFAALAAERLWLQRLFTATGLACTVALLGLMVAGLVLLLAPTSEVFRSLPEPWHPTITAALNDPRVIAAQIAMRMFFASPLLGTGIDSYQDVFARFHDSDYTLFFAHNDYAQLLAETGAAGVVTIALMAYVLGKRLLTFYFQAKGEYRVLNAGPWAALAGIAAHSAFDWNLHLPANAFLACVVGGLCASSVPPAVPRWAHGLADRIPEIACRTVFIVAAGTCLAFLTRDALSDHAQKGIREQLYFPREKDRAASLIPSDETLDRAMAFAAEMAGWDPANSRLSMVLGQASLHRASLAALTEDRGRWIDASAKWFLLAKWAAPLGRGFPQSAKAPPP
jgi:O-antigen ligase